MRALARMLGLVFVLCAVVCGAVGQDELRLPDIVDETHPLVPLLLDERAGGEKTPRLVISEGRVVAGRMGSTVSDEVRVLRENPDFVLAIMEAVREPRALNKRPLPAFDWDAEQNYVWVSGRLRNLIRWLLSDLTLKLREGRLAQATDRAIACINVARVGASDPEHLFQLSATIAASIIMQPRGEVLAVLVELPETHRLRLSEAFESLDEDDPLGYGEGALASSASYADALRDGIRDLGYAAVVGDRDKYGWLNPDLVVSDDDAIALIDRAEGLVVSLSDVWSDDLDAVDALLVEAHALCETDMTGIAWMLLGAIHYSSHNVYNSCVERREAIAALREGRAPVDVRPVPFGVLADRFPLLYGAPAWLRVEDE